MRHEKSFSFPEHQSAKQTNARNNIKKVEERNERKFLSRVAEHRSNVVVRES